MLIKFLRQGLTATFMCQPIEGFWMVEKMPKCIDVVKYIIVSQSVNIFIDVALIALPILMVHTLRLTVAQRANVIATFSITLA